MDRPFALPRSQASLVRSERSVDPGCRERVPDEIYAAPKTWTEKAYPKLIYYNRLPKGGHFAAWEQPELFSEEIRAAFKSLR
jgi:pimeloyl-ACP methyl ester carboxylesterase